MNENKNLFEGEALSSSTENIPEPNLEEQTIVTEPVVQPTESVQAAPVVQPTENVPIEPVAPAPVETEEVNPNNPQQQMMDQMNNSEITPVYESPAVKEKKKFPIGLLLFIIILLALVGAGAYFLINLGSPKNIVSGVINNLYSKVEKSLDEAKKYDLKKESIKTKADIEFETDIEEIKEINDVKLSYSFGLDYKEKLMEAGISLKEDDKKLIDALAYIINSNMYVSLPEDYKSIIKIGSSEIDLSQIETADVSIDDVKYVLKTSKEYLIESLDMNDFKKSKETIKINSSDVKVTKLNFTLNDTTYKKISSNMADKCLANDEFIAKLSKVLGLEKSEVKDMLKDAKEDIEYTSDAMTFNIYTKGLKQELVGIDIYDEDIKFEVRINGDTTNIDITSGNETTQVVVTKEKETYKISISGKLDDEKYVCSIETTSKKVSDKKYEGKLILNAKYSDQKIGMTVDYETIMGDKIADIDVTGAKDFSTLTEEDMIGIEESILKKLQTSKLFKKIMSLTGADSLE